MIRLFLGTGLLLSSAVCGNAQPIDCNAIKSSKIPIQLTMKSGDPEFIAGSEDVGSLPPNSDAAFQLYRNDDDFLVAYAVSSDRLTKYIFERGFISSSKISKNGSPDVEQEIVYDSKPQEDLKSKGKYFKNKYKIISIADRSPGATTTIEQDFRFIKSDGVVIGPCRFKINVFEYEQKTTEKDGEVTVLPKLLLHYAPELGFSVLSQSVLSRGGKAYARVTRRAVKIDTQFVPVSEK